MTARYSRANLERLDQQVTSQCHKLQNNSREDAPFLFALATRSITSGLPRTTGLGKKCALNLRRRRTDALSSHMGNLFDNVRPSLEVDWDAFAGLDHQLWRDGGVEVLAGDVGGELVLQVKSINDVRIGGPKADDSTDRLRDNDQG